MIVGLIWHLDFPVNKNLWSSSYTLLTGGISLLLLSLFYYVIDVKGYHRWTFFFRVIGMNSIFIYVSPLIIDYMFAAKGLFTWAGQLAVSPYSEVVMAVCKIITAWIVLYLLYKKNVFIKI